MKIELVENWTTVMWRSAVVRVAALGVSLPEILQLLADNFELLQAIALSPSQAGWFRLLCLVGVVLLRPVRQQSMNDQDLKPMS